MRLVNANNFAKWLTFLIYELNNEYRILNYNPEHDYTDEQKQFGTFIINHIKHILNDVEPEVKAIPVEWVDHYIKHKVEITGITEEVLYINDMLRAWEKENETKIDRC